MVPVGSQVTLKPAAIPWPPWGTCCCADPQPARRPLSHNPPGVRRKTGRGGSGGAFVVFLFLKFSLFSFLFFGLSVPSVFSTVSPQRSACLSVGRFPSICTTLFRTGPTLPLPGPQLCPPTVFRQAATEPGRPAP